MGGRPFMWYLLFNVALQYTVLGFWMGEYDPIVAQFPRPMLFAWYFGMIFAILITLSGSSFFRKKFFGLVMQRVGSIIMGTLSVANMFLIALILDLTNIYIVLALISITTFAIACFWNFWQIGQYMKYLGKLGKTSFSEELK